MRRGIRAWFGALVGLVLGLDWAGAVVWPAVIGVLQIRERFDVGLWSSSSPEAGRRRECRQFPKDMLQPRPDGEK